MGIGLGRVAAGRRKAGWGAFGLALAGMLWSNGLSAQSMAVPGKFDVSPSGAATYSIPIAVPPGTAGMIPALSLDYSSQAGDGILGFGWSLGGLPSIGRCPQTMVQDGVVGAVNYDNNDRFCLEGQRLVVINGGTYGADGSEYRTEIDGFSRILAHGSAGNGPAWFEVHSKSGQVMEFGHTADSQVLAQGKATARAWAVDKVTDSKGNYLSVTYTVDAADGQVYPARVDYTGNASAGLATNNSVQLFYTNPRPDVSVGYQAGSVIKSTVLLNEIKAFTGTTLVNDYKLTYSQSATMGKSQLASVALCAGDGSCLPATAFNWVGDGNTLFASPSNSGNSTDTCLLSCGPFLTGDVNGDGKTDLIHITTGGKVITWLSNGDGTYKQVVSSTGDTCLTACGYFLTGDVNGDGKTDLIHIAGSEVITWLSKGDGTYNAVAASAPGDTCLTACGYFLAGDVNGDGKTDLSHIASPYVITWLSKGDGTYTQVVTSSAADTCLTCGSLTAGDVNGDGKTDLIHIASPYVITWLSKGDGTYSQVVTSSSVDTCLNACGYFTVGDVNGDGKTDLIHIASPYVITWLSKGDGTYSQVVSSTTDTCLTCGSFMAGDVNGDGKTDLIHIASPYVITWLSKGDGTYTTVVSSSPDDTCLTCGSLLAGDVNGDGRTDLIHLTGNTGVTITWQSLASRFLISNITTGMGASDAITYAPLTNNSIYSKDNTSTYPVQDIQAPINVVSQVNASNGVGGTFSSTYNYVGLKADLSGRGPLGFRQMTVIDPQRNIKQTTSYQQNFPFIGLVSTRNKGVVSGLALNQNTNGYAFRNNSGGTTVSAPSSTSAPYQVVLQQNVTASWDLDGSGLPSATTQYGYDGYGNPTQVWVTTADGARMFTSNTYLNDTTHWFLGRLLASSVTNNSATGSFAPTPAPSTN